MAVGASGHLSVVGFFALACALSHEASRVTGEAGSPCQHPHAPGRPGWRAGRRVRVPACMVSHAAPRASSKAELACQGRSPRAAMFRSRQPGTRTPGSACEGRLRPT